MIYIENEGAVFRGKSVSYPTEIWSRKSSAWIPYTGRVPKDSEWGSEIDEAEAKRLTGEGASAAA